MIALRLTAIALLGLSLGGCNWQTVSGSVAGGECKVFERPQYAVRGARPYDQNWIDNTVEGGVGGCGWKRPAARPASLDAVPGKKSKAAPPKKLGLIKRIKDRVAAPFTAPVAPVVEVPAPPIAAAPAPPPPRDPVDELLQPSVIRRVQ